jgi:hypothetical protein
MPTFSPAPGSGRAGLLALLSAGWHRLLWQKLRASRAMKLRALLFFVMALLLTSHQSYVEFFGFTMMAFHLRYLYDSAFIAANGQSMLGWPLAVYLALTAIILIFQSRLGKVRLRHGGKIFVAVLLLLVFLHNRNIHWRVQWFIPENLQMNVLEKLHSQLIRSKAIEPVSAAERERLLALLQLPPTAKDFPGLLREVKDHPTGSAHPISQRLKEQGQNAVAAKQKPIVAVMLLESLRPAEIGYFAPGTPSLTPQLDRLAQTSIVFMNAWSTGSVTRGGQEAVFCGHISSRDTSLMRYDAVAPIRCLSDVLQKPLPRGERVETFWYHGGNGLFDNQVSFWQKHGMQQLLTQDHFPSESPRTSWGVGDITFLRRSAAELKKRQQETEADALAGMLLTVTNHIPWDMPRDVVPYALPEQAQHPSYLTTAYTDHAIGLFVERLRELGLWDSTLLILATDHGNQVPPYHDLYKDRSTSAARLQSHMNFMITGGLAEKALQDLKLSQLKRDALVSQVDISRFLADTLGLDDFSSMGEDPFHSARRLPVLSRLEQHLFDPATQSLWAPNAWQSRPLDGDAEQNILFYRAYIDYISTR